MPLSTDQIVRFADNPYNKTVTAYFLDGSIVVIESMSGVNYTLPPGYGDTSSLSDPQHRIALSGRTARYYSELATQLDL